MATWAVEARPSKFADVLGQTHIAPVLSAMVRAARAGERFPPALTLYGPRGTGKTTVGRIIARALNCTGEQPGEPCGACSSCLAGDRSPGVEEIDMASHGSVEDIRSLRDSAAYSIATSWRVYLLDEVHSASNQAFNALLKILEEPPPFTLFLLVTTEPDRIPETIRSRAMEFEFRRIPTSVITDRLRALAELHQIDDRVAEDVYPALAARARGGMRDAVMSLEQLSYREGPLTLETVDETFGSSDLAERLLDFAVKGDIQTGLARLDSALASAVNPVRVLESLTEGVVALMTVSFGVPATSVLAQGAPVSAAWLQAQAGIPTTALVAAMRVLWDARPRVTSAAASAGVSLAVAYTLLVQALAPSRFASSAHPAAASPVSRIPGGHSPAPPHINPREAERRISASQLQAILNAENPLTLDEVRDLVDRVQTSPT